MNSKHIFFDIDGTLYDPVVHVPESTKSALEKLKKNGHHIYLSTGRTRCMLSDELLDLGFDGIVGGSGTYLEYAGKELYRYEMPTEENKSIVDIFHKYNMQVFAEGVEHLYCDDYTRFSAEELVEKLFDLHDFSCLKHVKDSDMVVSKISGMCKDETSDLQGALKELSEKYDCVTHRNDYLETITRGFSKANKIVELSKIVGFDMADTVAFGDSLNDLEMLLTVNIGVAMGNSKPEVLKQIKIHTSDIREDGIYKGLEMLGLI